MNDLSELLVEVFTAGSCAISAFMSRLSSPRGGVGLELDVNEMGRSYGNRKTYHLNAYHTFDRRRHLVKN